MVISQILNTLKRKFTELLSKIVPTLYFDFIGILGALKYISFKAIGIFKPIYREARRSDMRIVAHKVQHLLLKIS
jgi:hypothetical protein